MAISWRHVSSIPYLRIRGYLGRADSIDTSGFHRHSAQQVFRVDVAGDDGRVNIVCYVPPGYRIRMIPLRCKLNRPCLLYRVLGKYLIPY